MYFFPCPPKLRPRPRFSTFCFLSPFSLFEQFDAPVWMFLCKSRNVCTQGTHRPLRIGFPFLRGFPAGNSPGAGLPGYWGSEALLFQKSEANGVYFVHEIVPFMAPWLDRCAISFLFLKFLQARFLHLQVPRSTVFSCLFSLFSPRQVSLPARGLRTCHFHDSFLRTPPEPRPYSCFFPPCRPIGLYQSLLFEFASPPFRDR